MADAVFRSGNSLSDALWNQMIITDDEITRITTIIYTFVVLWVINLILRMYRAVPQLTLFTTVREE